MQGRCVCSHPKVVHKHYRAQQDCALCPCVRYRERLTLPEIWQTIISRLFG